MLPLLLPPLILVKYIICIYIYIVVEETVRLLQVEMRRLPMALLLAMAIVSAQRHYKPVSAIAHS